MNVFSSLLSQNRLIAAALVDPTPAAVALATRALAKQAETLAAARNSALGVPVPARAAFRRRAA